MILHEIVMSVMSETLLLAEKKPAAMFRVAIWKPHAARSGGWAPDIGSKELKTLEDLNFHAASNHETLDLDSRPVKIRMRPQPDPGWTCDCSLVGC